MQTLAVFGINNDALNTAVNVLLLVLVRLRRKVHFDGFLILVFGLGYGMNRVIEDFLREDTRRLGLTASQWTAITTVCLCLYVLAVLRRTPKWGRWDERAGPPATRSENRSGAETRSDQAILDEEDRGSEAVNPPAD